MSLNSATSGWRINTQSLFITLAAVALLSGVTFTSFLLSGSSYDQSAEGFVPHAAQPADQEFSGQDKLEATTPPDYGDDEFCKAHPDPGNIAVVIKTGATVLHDKVPNQLFTSLRCVSNPLIFSDLEQRLGRYHVHDVLSGVSPTEIKENPDFELYRLQQEYVATQKEFDIPKLKDMLIQSDDWRTKGKTAAWALDKYKFLHMVERSWELAPGRDWYLFVEGDTFVAWPNLLRWLSTLDPHEKMYFGNAIRMFEYPNGKLFFGHGGAGILLSRAAVEDFAVKHQGLSNKWDSRVKEMWFGDYALAAALHEELHLDITVAQPSMSEWSPFDTFYEETWCRPILTMHHVDSQLMNTLTLWEREHVGQMMLFRDMYNATFPLGMTGDRSEWDNGSADEQFALEVSDADGKEGPHSSYEACGSACEQNQACLQFAFVEAVKKCYLSRAFKFGKEGKSEEPSKSWNSGWMQDRIAQWVEEHTACNATAAGAFPAVVRSK